MGVSVELVRGGGQGDLRGSSRCCHLFWDVSSWDQVHSLLDRTEDIAGKINTALKHLRVHCTNRRYALDFDTKQHFIYIYIYFPLLYPYLHTHTRIYFFYTRTKAKRIYIKSCINICNQPTGPACVCASSVTCVKSMLIRFLHAYLLTCCTLVRPALGLL